MCDAHHIKAQSIDPHSTEPLEIANRAMNYFDYLSECTTIHKEERFDMWDFNDLTLEQYNAVRNHPKDILSVNLSTLPDMMYMMSTCKIENDNIKPMDDDSWRRIVAPLIITKNLQKHILCYPLAPDLIAAHCDVSMKSDNLNEDHYFKYIINKRMGVELLTKNELWSRRPNNKYSFNLTLIPTHPDIFMKFDFMNYSASLPDPESYEKYLSSKKCLFLRPSVCRIYLMSNVSKRVTCPMCDRMVTSYYHGECIRTNTGDDILFSLLRAKKPKFYIVCHRFQYSFHALECLDHLNHNCNRYKVFNGILYKEIKDATFISYSSMLNIKEYVLPAKIINNKCLH